MYERNHKFRPITRDTRTIRFCHRGAQCPRYSRSGPDTIYYNIVHNYTYATVRHARGSPINSRFPLRARVFVQTTVIARYRGRRRLFRFPLHTRPRGPTVNDHFRRKLLYLLAIVYREYTAAASTDCYCDTTRHIVYTGCRAAAYRFPREISSP